MRASHVQQSGLPSSFQLTLSVMASTPANMVFFQRLELVRYLRVNQLREGREDDKGRGDKGRQGAVSNQVKEIEKKIYVGNQEVHIC